MVDVMTESTDGENDEETVRHRSINRGVQATGRRTLEEVWREMNGHRRMRLLEEGGAAR